MSETLNPTPNGRAQRRSLSAELDRFDRMIDGLDQGIKEVIADGVKESIGAAVGEAVRATLLELVSHPDVLGMLGDGVVPEGASIPLPGSPVAANRRSLLQRFGDNLADFGQWLAAKLSALGRGLTWPVRKLLDSHAARGNRPLLGALFIGVLVGCGASLGTPWIAAIISGLGAMGATIGAQLIQWKRRVFAPA